MRTVTVTRGKKIFGLFSDTTQILIDGQSYAQIEPETTETFEIDENPHRIQASVNLASASGNPPIQGTSNVIAIPAGTEKLSFDLEIKANIFGAPKSVLTAK